MFIGFTLYVLGNTVVKEMWQGGNCMDRKGLNIREAGIVSPSPVWADRCPYCREKLSKAEALKRKVRKVYRCKNCGKTIDERYIIY